MAFPFLNPRFSVLDVLGIQTRVKYEMDTYEDRAQYFFHPRADTLAVSRVHMVDGIRVLLVCYIHTRSIPEGLSGGSGVRPALVGLSRWGVGYDSLVVTEMEGATSLPWYLSSA